MQIEPYDAKQVINLIKEAKHIAVIPSKVSEADAFTAGVGLYFMLKGLEGKNVEFIYPWKIPDGCENLIKAEELSTDITSRELVVSIDYSDTPAAKAHYSTEKDVLNIRVSPIPKDFDIDRVKASIKGFDFDLVFTLGVQHLVDLGNVSKELKEEMENAKIVNIDNTAKNTRFGAANVIDISADRLSLVVFRNSDNWELIPDIKSATALLQGMSYKTQKLD